MHQTYSSSWSGSQHTMILFCLCHHNKTPTAGFNFNAIDIPSWCLPNMQQDCRRSRSQRCNISIFHHGRAARRIKREESRLQINRLPCPPSNRPSKQMRQVYTHPGHVSADGQRLTRQQIIDLDNVGYAINNGLSQYRLFGATNITREQSWAIRVALHFSTGRHRFGSRYPG
jgi:hypothetical protein